MKGEKKNQFIVLFSIRIPEGRVPGGEGRGERPFGEGRDRRERKGEKVPREGYLRSGEG